MIRTTAFGASRSRATGSQPFPELTRLPDSFVLYLRGFAGEDVAYSMGVGDLLETLMVLRHEEEAMCKALEPLPVVALRKRRRSLASR